MEKSMILADMNIFYWFVITMKHTNANSVQISQKILYVFGIWNNIAKDQTGEYFSKIIGQYNQVQLLKLFQLGINSMHNSWNVLNAMQWTEVWLVWLP